MFNGRGIGKKALSILLTAVVMLSTFAADYNVAFADELYVSSESQMVEAEDVEVIDEVPADTNEDETVIDEAGEVTGDETEEAIGEEPVEESEAEAIVITFAAGVGGTVSMAVQTLTDEDEVAAVYASAVEGYEFVNWTQDGTVVSEDATFTPAKQAASYVANFEATVSSPAFLQVMNINGVTITLTAKEGVLPAGSYFTAEEVTANVQNTVAKDLETEETEMTSVIAYDINLFDKDGNKMDDSWASEGSVQVTFAGQRVAEIAAESETLEVIHVADNGTVAATEAVVDVTETLVNEVAFDAEHFTIYAVTGTASVKRATYIFKVNGTEVDKQILKNGESLTQPETPDVADNQTFKGWYNGEVLFTNFATPVSVTENSTTTLNAKIVSEYRVFFMNTTGDVYRTVVAEDKSTVSTKVSDVTVPVDNVNKAHVGWTLTEGSDAKVESVTINGADVTLYPVVSEGKWINFNSNGGSYVAPVFTSIGSKVTKPANPTKVGYDFVNWYTDEACTKVYDFNKAVTADLSYLYAKWNAKDVKYRVIYWQENAEDDGYSFKESEEKTGKAGTTTNLTNSKTYDGFTYNAELTEQATIAGDGSTIVNVYFTRNVYSVCFYESSKTKVYSCGLTEHTHSKTCKTLTCTTTEHTHSYTRTSGGGSNKKYYGGCYPVSGAKKNNTICGLSAHTHGEACYGEPYVCGLTAHNHGTSRCTSVDAYPEITALRITAKHGSTHDVNGVEISTLWPNNISSYSNVNWGIAPDKNTYQVNLLTMPLGGDEFYNRGTASNSETAYYYTENLTGGDYSLHHSDTSPGTGYTVTVEDMYEIQGFTYASGTGNGNKYNGAKFYYTRNTYKVVLINGGTQSQVEKKYQASLAGVTVAPTKPAGVSADAVFDGWYLNEYFTGSKVEYTAANTMPAENITLYAHWVLPSYDVDFELNGGAPHIDSQNVEKDNAVTRPADPTKEGYTFAGWTLNGQPFNFDSYKVNSDIELEANWFSNNAFTVAYNAGEGSNAPSDSKTYAEGAKAVVKAKATAPAGKYFVGWEDEAGNVYYPGDAMVINSEVAKNAVVTLTAKYALESEKVTITYHSNYPEGSQAANYVTPAKVKNDEFIITDLSGAGFTAPNGYKFLGWSKNASATAAEYVAGNSVGVDTAVPNDLYAIWELDEASYSIEIHIQTVTDRKPVANAYVYSSTYETGKKTIGEAVTVPATKPSVPGYTYDHASASSVTVTKDGANKLILYYNAETVTVTYSDRVKGTTTVLGADTYEVFAKGSTVSATERKQNAYSGYKYDSADAPVVVNTDTTLCRYYVPVQSTLVLKANGGTWSDGSTADIRKTDAFNATYSFTAPTRTGYEFTGWTKSTPFSGTVNGSVYTFGATENAVDTMTANWRALAVDFTVNHYIKDLGASTYTLKDTETISDQVTDTVVTAADYAKSYTGFTYHHANVATATVKGDGSLVIDLYYNRNAFTVTYDYNGGHAAADSADAQTVFNNVEFGAIIPAYAGSNPVKDPVKPDDYNFTGWTNASGYTIGGVMPNSDVTFVANYEAVRRIYHVTASIENGTYSVGLVGKNAAEWGSSRTFTYAANKGYELSSVKVNGTEVKDTYPQSYTFSDISVDNQTIDVKYTEKTVDLTFNAEKIGAATAGSVSKPSQTVGVVNGTPAAVTATPAAGYSFSYWKKGDEVVSREATLTADIISANAKADGLYVATGFTAVFVENEATLTFSVADGQATFGSITGAASQTVGVVSGTVTAVSANAATGYVFDYWTVNGVMTELPAALTTTAINANAKSADLYVNTTFVAHFKEAQATLTFGPRAYGNVSGTTRQTINVVTGVPTEVTAVPAPGHHFTEWLVNGTAVEGLGETLTVSDIEANAKDANNHFVDTHFTAVFEQNTATFSYSARNGSVDTASQTVYVVTGEGITAVSATRDNGYTFDHWEVNGTEKTGYTENLSVADIKAMANKDANGHYADSRFVAVFTAMADVTLTYEQEFLDNAGNYVALDTQNLNPETGVAVAKTAPDVRGYQFVGWVVKNGSSASADAELSATEINAVAKATGAYVATTFVAQYKNTAFTAFSISGGTETYNDTSYTFAITGADQADVTFYSDRECTKALGEKGTKPSYTEAGTYTVYAKATKDGYVDSSVVSATLVINPRPIVVAANGGSKTYDGTALYATEVAGKRYTVSGVEGNTESGLVSGHTTTGTVSESMTDYSATDVATNVAGFKVMKGETDVTANYDVTYVTGSLHIDKKPVTVKAQSQTFKYDRTFHSWNYADVDTTVEGSSLAAGHVLDSWTVSGSRMFVGSEDNKLTAVVIKDATGADVTGNYDTTLVNGTLTVVKKDGTVVITPANKEKVYDGTPLTAEYSVNDGALIDGDELTATLRPASITDVDTKTVSVASYSITSGETVVTDNYTVDASATGQLKITKRPVTITAGSDSKTYDGTPLTKNTYTVEKATANRGLLEGHRVVEGTVTVSGSATYVSDGKVTNALNVKNIQIVDENGKDVTANYAVTPVNGTLEVTPVTGTIVITANSNEKVYDGEALTALKDGSYATYTGTLMRGDELNVAVSGSITDYAEGGVASHVTSYSVKRGDKDVTDCYTFGDSVDGLLKITKRPVTLTSKDDSKVYDGTALQKEEVTVSGNGFVGTQGVEYSNFASVTEVTTAAGVDNTFEYTAKRGTNLNNYAITPVYGKLVVTENDARILATITGGEFEYDGEAHGATVTVSTLPTGYTLVKATSSSSATHVAEGTVVAACDDLVIKNAQDTVVYDLKNNIKRLNVGYANGSIKITPATLTVVTPSDSKTYDGTALTKAGTVNGYKKSETATFTTTGTQTAVGSSENTYTLVFDGTAAASDYTVSEDLGTLTVNEYDGEIVVTTTGGEFEYDGKAHGATVAVTGVPTGYTVVTKTSSATATHVADGTVKATCDTLVIKNAASEDVTSKLNVRYVDDTIKITPATLTVVTPSDSKTYDGTALTKAGTISGYKNGETATFATTGTQTAVGSSDNTYRLAFNGTAAESDYTVEETIGKLTVTEFAGEITVTTTGGEFEYDGKAHGATVTVTGVPTGYTVATKTSSATATHVAEGTVDATCDTLVINNAAGEDVTSKLNIKYVDGTIKITPATLTVVTPSDSKTYDGTPLTAEGSVRGYKNGETATFTTTGSQTEVTDADGVDNTYSLVFNGTATATDYTVEETIGKLVVNENRTEITVTTTGGEFVYDGEAHGATVAVTGVPTGYTVVTKESSATATHVAEGTVTATCDTLVIKNASGKDVTSKLNIKYVNGTIKITPATLTVKTESANKTYDGKALTAKGTIDGFKKRETATFTVTGSQTNVGESNNTYSLKFDKSAAATDYTVSETIGKLVVTEYAGEIIVTTTGGTFTYDGKEHKATVVVTGVPEGYKTEKAETKAKATHVSEANEQKPLAATCTKLVIKNAAGTDVTSKLNIKYVNDTIVIKPATLTVKTESASKTYDGEALTAKGTINGFVNKETATFKVTGSQTEVGSSDNTYELKFDKTAKASDYTVSKTIGKLTVTEYAGEITVTTTGGTFTYDGKAHSATVEVSPLPKGYKLVTATSNATATHVSEASAKKPLKATCNTLVIQNASGKDVTSKLNIKKVDGQIVINPATLTVTTPTASKTYDGEALTAAGTITGFKNGETATFKTTGSQTEVGSSDNTYSLKFDKTAKADDYTVSKTIGKLTVNEYAGEITVTTTGGTFTYDGKAHPATVEVSPLPKGYELVTATSKATATHVSEASAKKPLKATCDTLVIKNASGKDVTSKLNIKKVDGQIVINPATLTVTTPTASKTYDGEALTAAGRISGFKNNETATFKTTGSQTAVGSSDNTYSLKFDKTAKESDYTVSATVGKLTVNEFAGKITVTTTADSHVYDGHEHGATVAVTYVNNAGNTVNGLPKGYTVETATSSAAATYVAEAPEEDPITATCDTLVIKNAANENVTSKLNIEKVDDKLVISQRPITFKANDNSKEYDGTAVYAAVNASGDLAGKQFSITSGSLADTDEVDASVTGEQKYVGTSPSMIALSDNGDIKGLAITAKPVNTIARLRSTLGMTANLNENYKILTQPGELEITAPEVPYVITLTANSNEKVYDGTALTAEKTGDNGAYFYTVEGELVGEGDAITASVTETITNVGTQATSVTAASIMNGERDLVADGIYTIETENGLLSVSARPITLIANNVSKTKYDGVPFEASEMIGEDGKAYTVKAIEEGTIAGLAEGQSISAEDYSVDENLTVSREDATHLNIQTVVITDAEGNEVTGNYDLYVEDGDAVVGREDADKTDVTLTGNSSRARADGVAKKVTGYSRTSADLSDEVLAGLEFNLEADGTGLNVGEYPVTFKVVEDGEQYEIWNADEATYSKEGIVITDMYGNDVTDYIDLNLVNGNLSIIFFLLPEDPRVLGARREDLEAVVPEGSVLGAARAPKTSDQSKAILWMLVMGSSTLGAAAILAQKKREQEEQ